MSTMEHDALRQLDDLRMEVMHVEQLYLQTYSFRDIRQIDGEKEWGNLKRATEHKTHDTLVVQAMKQLFKGQVESLLWEEAQQAWKGSKDALAQQLLSERQPMVSDMLCSTQAVTRILHRFRDGMQRTMWSNAFLTTRRMHDSDIPQVKKMEARLHEQPWIGTDFAKFFEKLARSSRLYDRYGKQSPLLAEVAADIHHGKIVAGYMVANAMNGDRCYPSIKGTLQHNRRSMQVLTHGAEEQHAEEAAPKLLTDVLHAAHALGCTRIEDLFEEHHKA